VNQPLRLHVSAHFNSPFAAPVISPATCCKYHVVQTAILSQMDTPLWSRLHSGVSIGSLMRTSINEDQHLFVDVSSS